MIVSTRGRYALRVMLDLAEHAKESGNGIPLKAVAERQEISKKYLESIVSSLVKGGLITGSSGRNGGYRLTRPAEEYTVGEILELTEGPFVVVSCLSSGAEKPADCPRASECRTLPLWTEFGRIAKSYFDGKKLSDLLPPPPEN